MIEVPRIPEVPLFAESQAFYRYAPSDDHICDPPSLSASRLQGEVLLLVLGDNSFLDIKNQTVPSILADTQVISGKFFRTAAATSEQLIFFWTSHGLYPAYPEIEDFSGTVSDISFNMDIPDSPCQKNIRIPPRIMPVKKAFLFYSLKKEGHSPVSV